MAVIAHYKLYDIHYFQLHLLAFGLLLLVTEGEANADAVVHYFNSGRGRQIVSVDISRNGFPERIIADSKV